MKSLNTGTSFNVWSTTCSKPQINTHKIYLAHVDDIPWSYPYEDLYILNNHFGCLDHHHIDPSIYGPCLFLCPCEQPLSSGSSVLRLAFLICFNHLVNVQERRQQLWELFQVKWELLESLTSTSSLAISGTDSVNWRYLPYISMAHFSGFFSPQRSPMD